MQKSYNYTDVGFDNSPEFIINKICYLKKKYNKGDYGADQAPLRPNQKADNIINKIYRYLNAISKD